MGHNWRTIPCDLKALSLLKYPTFIFQNQFLMILNLEYLVDLSKSELFQFD
jgi:hypothetical protein